MAGSLLEGEQRPRNPGQAPQTAKRFSELRSGVQTPSPRCPGPPSPGCPSPLHPGVLDPSTPVSWTPPPRCPGPLHPGVLDHSAQVSWSVFTQTTWRERIPSQSGFKMNAQLCHSSSLPGSFPPRHSRCQPPVWGVDFWKSRQKENWWETERGSGTTLELFAALYRGRRHPTVDSSLIPGTVGQRSMGTGWPPTSVYRVCR